MEEQEPKEKPIGFIIVNGKAVGVTRGRLSIAKAASIVIQMGIATQLKFMHGTVWERAEVTDGLLNNLVTMRDIAPSA